MTVTVSHNSGKIRRQECDRNSVEDPDTDQDPGQKGLANFRLSGSGISILDPAIKNKEKNPHKSITKSKNLRQFYKHDKLLFIIVSDCKSRGNYCKGRERL